MDDRDTNQEIEIETQTQIKRRAKRCLSLSLTPLPHTLTHALLSPNLSLSLLDHLSGRNKVAVTRMCTNIAPLGSSVCRVREGGRGTRRESASKCVRVCVRVREREVLYGHKTQ